MKRSLFIDILRVTAIMLVVLQHIISTSSLSNELQPYYFSLNFFNIFHIYYGNIGIWLFLFASGCSLALNYPNLDTVKEVKNYLGKRIIRIYPTYWTAILFNITVFNTVIPSLTGVDIARMVSGFQAFFVSTFEDFYGKVNGTFWFIGVIVSLYFLYPIVLLMIRKRPNVALLSLLIVEVCSRIIMSQTVFVRGYDWFPLCRVFDFGLGVYIVQKNFYWKAPNLSVPITFLAKITFPIYLVHIPLLVLVNYNIVLFFITLAVISTMLYTFEVALQQRLSKGFKK
jgi:peptidoglycan/LPS O-acetylase OafA/YrhL